MHDPAIQASDAAIAFGRRTAGRLLDRRKGHGGGEVSYRQMSRVELAALAALAYEAGLRAGLARDAGAGIVEDEGTGA